MGKKGLKAVRPEEEPEESRQEEDSSRVRPLRPSGQRSYNFLIDYLETDELRELRKNIRQFATSTLDVLVPDPRRLQIDQRDIEALLDADDRKTVDKDTIRSIFTDLENVKEIKRSRAQEFLGKDGRGRFPMDLWKPAAERGLFGVPFPEKYGGLGLGELGNVVMLEELSKVDSGFTTSIALQVGLWEMLIYLDGTEEQREKYLVPSIAGEMKGAFALTEPGVGSDALKLKTRAEEKDGYFLLNGEKQFITSGSYADYVVVFAVTDPDLGPAGVSALIVATDSEGFEIGEHEDKMGIRASETVPLKFTNVKVPLENIVGGPEKRAGGNGFATALRAIDISRVTLAAGIVGGAIASLNYAADYASERRVSSGILIEQGNIIQDLGAMERDIWNLQTSVWTTAQSVDDWIEDGMPTEGYRSPFTAHSAALKALAPVGRNVISQALITFGGYGYIEEYPLAKLYRDQIISEIFEGTTYTCLMEIVKKLRSEGEYSLGPA